MTDTIQKEKESFNTAAWTYLNQGLYREALEIAGSWLKKYPMDAEANIVCCHALVKMGKMDSVGEHLDNVEDTILKLSRIYAFMGDASLKDGLNQEAIWCYKRFLSINPESKDAAAVSKKLQGLMPTPAPVDEPSVSRKRDHGDVQGITPDFFTVTLAKLYNKQGHLHLAADVLFEVPEKDSGDHHESKPPEKIGSKSEYKRRKEKVVQELTRWLNNMEEMRCK